MAFQADYYQRHLCTIRMFLTLLSIKRARPCMLLWQAYIDYVLKFSIILETFSYACITSWNYCGLDTSLLLLYYPLTEWIARRNSRFFSNVTFCNGNFIKCKIVILYLIVRCFSIYVLYNKICIAYLIATIE